MITLSYEYKLIPTNEQARVVKKASGYYIILSCQLDVDVPDVPYGGYAIGIDMGLEKFLATSEGELITNPRFFVTAQGKLKLLQRMLKNKKKGSRRWNMIKKRIARLHEYITNSRKDFYFKLAHHLCDKAGAMFKVKSQKSKVKSQKNSFLTFAFCVLRFVSTVGHTGKKHALGQCVRG